MKNFVTKICYFCNFLDPLWRRSDFVFRITEGASALSNQQLCTKIVTSARDGRQMRSFFSLLALLSPPSRPAC